MLTKVDESNFASLIGGEKPMMIDFWAAWCNPCRMLGPVIEELADDYDGRAVVGKCNVDDNPALAGAMGIRSIPAVVFFKGGKPVDLSVGLVPKEVLVEKMDAIIK